MPPNETKPAQASFLRLMQAMIPLSLVFLLVEFFDELAYGIQGATLPVIRSDLGLSYAQVGLLLGVPVVIGAIVEPILMLLGDTRLRKSLVLSGGVLMSLALGMVASTASFSMLLLALILVYSSSGAFVSLSQATLMDINPGRETKMMARWTLSGSLANTLGPLLAGAGFALALSWRWNFAALALLGVALAASLLPRSFPKRNEQLTAAGGFPGLLRNLLRTARKPGMMRWMLLLQLSDLMLDVFVGYVALYFTDVVGTSPAMASIALGILMVSGLVADALLIPLLERFPGRTIVRASAAMATALYAAWLLAPWLVAKYALLAAVGVARLGWYAVLKGEAYATAPGYSGTVSALTSLARLFGGALTWLIGWIASSAGLPIAMSILLVGPLALIFLVPSGVERVE